MTPTDVQPDRRRASRSCAYAGMRSFGSRRATAHGQCAWLDRSPAGKPAWASDLDVLVDVGAGASLLTVAALQNDLEDLLGCPVHVVTTSGLKYAREHVPEQIEGEAVPL